MKHIPKVMTCRRFAQQRHRLPQRCKEAFQECCEYIQGSLDQTLILAREGQRGLTRGGSGLLRVVCVWLGVFPVPFEAAAFEL